MTPRRTPYSLRLRVPLRDSQNFTAIFQSLATVVRLRCTLHELDDSQPRDSRPCSYRSLYAERTNERRRNDTTNERTHDSESRHQVRDSCRRMNATIPQRCNDTNEQTTLNFRAAVRCFVASAATCNGRAQCMNLAMASTHNNSLRE